jgi:hypothetical protein
MLKAIASGLKGAISAISPVSSLMGAGLSAASSLVGGNAQNTANAYQASLNRSFQDEQAQKSMEFAAGQTKQQMEFQERMRANQYQTTVADLKAAGLNPMLAYAQGGAGNLSGAAASGSAGSGAQATMGNPLGNAANSAREAAMAIANFKQLQTQNLLTQEQAEKTAADRNLSLDQAAYYRAMEARERSKMPGYQKYGAFTDKQISNYEANTRLLNAQSAYKEAIQPEARSIGHAYTTFPYLAATERGAKVVGDIVGSAKGARDMLRPTPTFNRTINYGMKP